MAGTKATDNVAVQTARFVVRDVLFDVVRFPVWWYTRGTTNAAQFVWQELLTVADRLSIRILLRNLFKPMYGDYSRSGRIISLFIRLIVFVFRLVGLILWAAVLLVALVAWLVVLPATVYQIVLQLKGG